MQALMSDRYGNPCIELAQHKELRRGVEAYFNDKTIRMFDGHYVALENNRTRLYKEGGPDIPLKSVPAVYVTKEGSQNFLEQPFWKSDDYEE